MRRPLPDLSVYLVLDPGLCAEAGMIGTARAAVAAGVGVVQLRHKAAGTALRVEIGHALQAVLAGTGAALIVNDDVDAAIALGADGLHIGQGDMKPAAARAAIGPHMLLGLSVETEAQARALDACVVDYAGAGPVFGTPSKADHAPPVGMAGLARIVGACRVPAVAIGGLGAHHARDVIGTGAAGLAVISAICGRPDPGAAARTLVAAIGEARA